MLPILLASASPRRREILTTLGIPFVHAAVDVDESAYPGEAPREYLERIVGAKLARAESIAAGLGLRSTLVADTTVVLGDRMLAKPENPAEHRRMIASLSGRDHQVMTRFAGAVVRGVTHAETVTTQVTMRSWTADEIDRYVACGEGLDKAGGYAIQGLGGFAITSIHGSYTNVVGLPAAEVVHALRELGILSVFPLPTSPLAGRTA